MKRGKRPTNVRRRVLELRERLDLTQEELAAGLDISVHTVSQWENGKHTPSRRAWRDFVAFEAEHLGRAKR